MVEKLSIIIPVYNEEKYIGKIVEKILMLDFSELFNFLEVIIVDDGSTDNSYIEILKFSEIKAQVKTIRLTQNVGKGAAVKAGLQQASGDCFIVQDADLELLPNDILEMAKVLIANDLVMVNGSRFLNNVNTKNKTGMRNFANGIFSLFTSILNAKKITDLTCGYKLFTKELYEKIALKENRFGIEAELLTKALIFDKKRVIEFPVHYFPREISGGKKIRFTDGFRIIWVCIKYKFFAK